MNDLYVGAEGALLTITLIKSDGEAHDLANADYIELSFKRPNEAPEKRVAPEVFVGEDTKGRPALQYKIQPGDLPVAGMYTAQPYVEDPGGKWPYRPISILVHNTMRSE